jgi:hypothetical protein
MKRSIGTQSPRRSIQIAVPVQVESMAKSRITLLFSVFILALIASAALAQVRQFVVQLEALSNQEAALRRVSELRSGGVDAYLVRSEVPGKGILYRVRVGRFPTSAEARRRGQELQSRSLAESFFVTTWEPPVDNRAGTKPAASPVDNIASSPVTRKPPIDPPAVDTPITERVINASSGNASSGDSSTGTTAATPPAPSSSSSPVAPVVSGVSKPMPAEKPASTRVATSPRAPQSAPPVTASPVVISKSVPSKPVPSKSVPSKPVPEETTASTVPVVRSFVRFADRAIGYSLDRPENWEGGPLDQKETGEQNINAGALFRSPSDGAFLNVIWNPLDQANSADHDNDLIIELILRSMSSGDGTKQMKETSRRVVTENGQIKTYLDLKAQFESPGRSSMLDFSGKAIVVRGSKGILLVVTFFSNSSPADLPVLADQIMASITLP